MLITIENARSFLHAHDDLQASGLVAALLGLIPHDPNLIDYLDSFDREQRARLIGCTARANLLDIYLDGASFVEGERDLRYARGLSVTQQAWLTYQMTELGMTLGEITRLDPDSRYTAYDAAACDVIWCQKMYEWTLSTVQKPDYPRPDWYQIELDGFVEDYEAPDEKSDNMAFEWAVDQGWWLIHDTYGFQDDEGKWHPTYALNDSYGTVPAHPAVDAKRRLLKLHKRLDQVSRRIEHISAALAVAANWERS